MIAIHTDTLLEIEVARLIGLENLEKLSRFLKPIVKRPIYSLETISLHMRMKRDICKRIFINIYVLRTLSSPHAFPKHLLRDDEVNEPEKISKEKNVIKSGEIMHIAEI